MVDGGIPLSRWHGRLARAIRTGETPVPLFRQSIKRAAALVVAACAACASSAHGQAEYRLTDEDTWEASETAPESSADGQLAEARRALAANDPVRAENIATQWIDRFDNHPRLPDAYLLRGDALRAQEDYYEALFDYEFLARTYSGSEAFVPALQRELEIARLYADGLKRKLFGMRIVNADDEAEELLIRVQERLPGSRLAEEAGMALADFYFERRKMALAVDAYELFLENYPRSPHISKARRRLIYAYLASFKGPEFDPAGLYEARVWLQRLQVVEPTTSEQIGGAALLQRIDESDAVKRLATAKWYQSTGDIIAAELTIRRLLRKYPRSVAASDAMKVIKEIIPMLPASVLAEAPEYQALIGPVEAVQPAAPEPRGEPALETNP